jgi:glucose/arabinose dehydrogenase
MNPHIRFVRKSPINAATLVAAGLLSTVGAPAQAQTTHAAPTAASGACVGDNGGITLSPGFCATVFADKLGHARHMAVAANGVVYCSTWSGIFYPNAPPPPGGFLLVLQDTTGNGRADKIVRFGPTVADGNKGGTGTWIYKGYLYAETNDRIVRYPLPAAGIAPTAAAQTVVSGLPLTGDHPMHPFAIDAAGNLYVDLGAATNSCQSEDPHAGIAVACIAERQVSSPSPTISVSAAGASRTAPPPIGPSDARSRRRQIPASSRAIQVRCTATNSPLMSSTRATIAGP